MTCYSVCRMDGEKIITKIICVFVIQTLAGMNLLQTLIQGAFT